MWPRICNFHTVRKTIVEYPHLLGGRTTAQYRGKIKLHGINAGVQVRGDRVVAQSRTTIVTPGSDNFGFASWVESVKDDFIAANRVDRQVIIYGEWCGPGIQRGTAISMIPKRCFAVFAASPFDSHDELTDQLITDPETLSELVNGVPDTFVLPWYGEHIDIPWMDPALSLEPVAALISKFVDSVEKEDLWVNDTFGVSGIGEGIVYYPLSHGGRLNFGNLSFKAKGEKHVVVAHSKPAQVDPSVVSGAVQFADLVLPEARLEQGAREAAGGELSFDMKLMGPFLAWVNSDVRKECTLELEARVSNGNRYINTCLRRLVPGTLNTLGNHKGGS